MFEQPLQKRWEAMPRPRPRCLRKVSSRDVLGSRWTLGWPSCLWAWSYSPTFFSSPGLTDNFLRRRSWQIVHPVNVTLPGSHLPPSSRLFANAKAPSLILRCWSGGSACTLFILTCLLRIGEALRERWRHVFLPSRDFPQQEATFYIPSSKTGRDQ